MVWQEVLKHFPFQSLSDQQLSVEQKHVTFSNSSFLWIWVKEWKHKTTAYGVISSLASVNSHFKYRASSVGSPLRLLTAVVLTSRFTLNSPVIKRHVRSVQISALIGPMVPSRVISAMSMALCRLLAPGRAQGVSVSASAAPSRSPKAAGPCSTPPPLGPP